MQIVIYLFTFLLVSKDVVFTPAPNVIRVLVQSFALLIGTAWLLRSEDGTTVKALSPIWAYLFLLLISAQFSPFPVFANLQVLSLSACIILFAGAAAYSARTRADGDLFLARAVIIAYSIVCGASLLLLFFRPSLAFSVLDSGDAIGNTSRFRGVMAKSSMIASAAGLLVGLSVTIPGRRIFRLTAISMGLACLYLTQARTFWIALLISATVVAWLYRPRSRKWVLIACAAALTVVALLSNMTESSTTSDDAQTVVRTEGLDSLSGRDTLWTDSIAAIADVPLLGYGLTLGALGLPGMASSLHDSDTRLSDIASVSRTTTHNGILQAILDSGIPGALAYVLAMIVAPLRLIRSDTSRRYPHVLFVLAFITVANLGETVIYSGGVFDSVLYWAMIVFALNRQPKIGDRRTVGDPVPDNLLR